MARYKYRKEGDCIVYRDQILLSNYKFNSHVHFSEKTDKSVKTGPATYPKIPEKSLESPYRQKSPLRRRNPENYFPWFEANASQNCEKWTILAYRHNEEPLEEARLLHGGDIVRIKHAESGGYLTVDENSQFSMFAKVTGWKHTFVYIMVQTQAKKQQPTKCSKLKSLKTKWRKVEPRSLGMKTKTQVSKQSAWD